MVAQIDGEGQVSGDGVARRIADADLTNRDQATWRKVIDQRFQRSRHLGRSEQCIATEAHRCSAGMRGLPLHAHVEPADGLPARDDADRHTVLLQDRALLDMRLEVRIERLTGDGAFACVTRRRQGIRN